MNETQKRLTHWASLPAADPIDFPIRHHAWCLYVDSRDGLADGTTQNKQPFHLAVVDTQLDIFEQAGA